MPTCSDKFMRSPMLALSLSIAACITGCGNQPPAPRQAVAPQAQAVAPVKILQFYSPVSQVSKGEPAMVCYGVENARSVRLEPPVEQLKPAFSHCFQVTPNKTTIYKLTAEGLDGKTVSESFTVTVSGPAVSRGSMIQFFATGSAEILRGQNGTLCYGLSGANSVSIDPPVQELKPLERSCFVVKPSETTTYILKATGPGGRKETARLTLTVR
jgi:hypothetical protein